MTEDWKPTELQRVKGLYAVACKLLEQNEAKLAKCVEVLKEIERGPHIQIQNLSPITRSSRNWGRNEEGKT